MDAIRKQASKLREQVAKQQQAVIKQFSGTGYESSDVMVIDEDEMRRNQQLLKVYSSTRVGRDFQKEIVRAAEAFTAVGVKHIEAGTKLSEDCSRYGAQNTDDKILSKGASIYGDARKHVEKEREDLNKLLSSQILDPLHAMIAGAPLGDARHLAQRYSQMRREAETQAVEVSKRKARVRELPNPDNVAKLHAAEAKMKELRANMAVLGIEASAALAAVEAQQQRLTFQRLVALVEAEKNYHLRVAAILGEVEAEATHSINAASEKELRLSVGDYVVVRKVSLSGWSEGNCKGKGGWFPSDYVEKRQRLPSSEFSAEAYCALPKAVEVSKRKARVRELPNPDNVAKLHAAEAKMKELRANMAVLGIEASAALAAVEAQQQRLTFQRLVALVEAEKNYHLRVAAILGEVEAEIVPQDSSTEKTMYILAEATHSINAASEKELRLSVGDYVVVRKVSLSGWSEGNCKGKGGWFPSDYVEKRQRLPSSEFSAEAYCALPKISLL